MNDILFKNNNKTAINRLSERSFYANRKRNIFVILATALTTFMITSVLSLGFSYFDTFKLQQTRLIGTTADASLTSPTETQINKIKESEQVANVGLQQRVGSVDTTSMKDAALGLVWVDDTEWKEHRLPTISGVEGKYPDKENEIMVPSWALEQMGISNPQVGMKVKLTYQIGEKRNFNTGEFSLSGYFKDYSSSRTNNRGAIYVSKDFKEKADIPMSKGGGAMITFRDKEDVSSLCEELKNILGCTESQSFAIVPVSEANSVATILIAALAIVFIMISGYLLVYNILYISISKDIRFFGQLKTIGTTKRQIKQIVYRQVRNTSLIGIPIGMLAGIAVSFVIIPMAMRMMCVGNDALGSKISFSPYILIGAAIFTLITVFMGSMKPARIAGNISPIEALHYSDSNTKNYSKKKSHKIKLSRMAFENIFRNRKSAMLTFVSLISGMMLFIISSGLLSCMSPENFVKQWGQSDFALTYSMNEEKDIITQNILNEVKHIDGIKKLRLTYSASPKSRMDVSYDDAVFKRYLDSLSEKTNLDLSDPNKLASYIGNFYSGVYGIDSKYVEELNKTLEYPIDMKAFENGEVVLLSEIKDDNGKDLIPAGEKITVSGPNAQHTFTVADGFLDADFQSTRGYEHGTAPDLFISQKALSMLSPKVKLFRITFDTEGSHDDVILKQLKNMTSSTSGIVIQSRYEKRQEMQELVMTTKVLAIGLSSVLLLIGIMNFINTVVVSVNIRKHEFAVLESIGMTKKQIMKVLLYEGGYYWLLSFMLIATIGTAIYKMLYILLKKVAVYAVYSYPIWPITIVSGFVLVICLCVPVITYRVDIKSSVVERLNYN